MTYFIERKLTEEPAGEEIDVLQQWVRQKQSELRPSFLTLQFNKIRFALFGDSFSIAYGWIRETLPLSLKAHFMHFVNTARRLPNFNHSIKQNLKTMGHGILQSLYVPLGISISIFMQTFSFAARLTSLPFEGLRRLFQHYTKIEKTLFILQVLKNLVLAGLLLSAIAPYAASFAIYSAYAYVGALLANPVLRVIDFCLRSTGGYIQNETPLMSYQTTASIRISSLFPSFTFNRINEAINQLRPFFADIDILWNILRDDNWRTNHDLQQRFDAWIQNLNRMPNTILPIEQPLGTFISQIMQRWTEARNEDNEDVEANDPELADAIAASLEPLPRPLTPIADVTIADTRQAENNGEDDTHARRTHSTEAAEARRAHP